MGSGDSNIVFHILDVFFNMVWQIYWPLAFGLMLSSFIRNMLPVDTVSTHLGHTSVRSLSITTLLGVVSSSCSYAAASLSHTLLLKKATLANAMAFLVSSTNLIVEMFIVLVALLGWTFLWGEILGGLLLICFVALLFSRFFPKDVENELREKLASEGAPSAKHDCGMDMGDMHHEDHKHMNHEKAADDCGMEGMHSENHEHMHHDHSMHTHSEMHHDEPKSDCGMDMGGMHHEDHKHMNHEKAADDCGMDMGAMNHASHEHMHGSGTHEMSHTTPSKVTKAAGFFHMDLAMIGKEILIGVVVSSLLIAIVPLDGWRALFISSDANLPVWLHSFLDVIIGIFVAMIAYVCSVGNLLLAAALWHGGISFGGVIGFILADVLTIPMMRVYQKYYGHRPAKWMVGLLFIAILLTGLCVDVVFHALGFAVNDASLRPLIQDGFGMNFTTIMNLIFIPLSVWFYNVGKKANAGMGMSM
ncbi:permease [Enterovibrio sp. ZSDZ35]|uniref:Permease n=1 Tax=Enterovibrio qingdaonensis TaxID=2899818 RepID=A0ABT5QLR2_9GAMM|nr:permease [Enterovibrio sp. ZSDZ35]MDD1781928.1 permease [Enterovibrio sp. ZSDZ35]